MYVTFELIYILYNSQFFKSFSSFNLSFYINSFEKKSSPCISPPKKRKGKKINQCALLGPRLVASKASKAASY